MKLDSLTVRGYKSIKELEAFKFRNLNVLIGANGAGKSNLLSLFRLLGAVADGNLRNYVQKQGGPEALLFGGRKRTQEIFVLVTFGVNAYRILLEPTADNRFISTADELRADDYMAGTKSDHTQNATDLRGQRLYHFHDTSDAAAVKQPHPSNDNIRFKPDAANLAAFLAFLRKDWPSEYRRIVETVRLAAPFFGDFVIRNPLPKTVELEWTLRGDPDTPYRAHVLSDGTLRFICLTTLLLQPAYLQPDTILIDEPELGLHPYAINLLAEMLKQVTSLKQVIVSTQSVELLNNFEPKDVIVAGLEDGASVFKRLETDELGDWLEDYTLGELWKKNILGGRPSQ